jgi:hypothetical protein
MIVKIAPLSASELQLLLGALKAANANEKVSDSELLAFEKKALKYIADRRRNRIGLGARHIWGNAEKMDLAVLRKIWIEAGKGGVGGISEYRSKRGMFCPIPPISLPSKNPMVVVHSRSDFFDWLFARAVANSQWLLFVKCQLCGKVHLRRRARVESRYCTKKCQKAAGLEKILAGADQIDFEAWLLKQPETLPGRLQMQLARIEKSKSAPRKSLG